MSRTIESQLSLIEARERILAQAEPGEPIEVSLGEALGLILAEPVLADVDLPPFDRAAHDGYAVRAEEATVGALLRVVIPKRWGRASDPTIEAGEAGRVLAGDPMPPGTDSILRPAWVRPDPETGFVRVVEVLEAPLLNRDVTFRGSELSAGATVLAAGTRVQPAMVPLLAAQGCVHPYCHRRVRVSIVAVGNQWVNPADAPNMNRERNATNAALVALTLRAEAMPHDFQAVAGSKIRPTLERAATSPIVVIVGTASRPLAWTWKAMNYEPVVSGVAATGIARVRYGVIRDDDGKIVNHILQIPSDPIAASASFAWFVRPLIARLQGEVTELSQPTWILAPGQFQPATRRRARLVAASIRIESDGRPVATLLGGSGTNLLKWSHADGFVVFPERSGPWHGGDPVEALAIDSRP